MRKAALVLAALIFCWGAPETRAQEYCAGAIKAMRPWRVMERLSEIRQPALIIVGDLDRSTTPNDSFVLWRGLPSAQLCILPGCAHGAHMERPDYFNKIVADFLFGTRA
jgi:2-hydroxy-6-oxonona-2,4-dienedioate hydrolase